MDKTLYPLADKYKKYQVLAGNPKLKAFLPETKLFNQGELNAFIDKYQILFCKPVIGTGGGGIIKVTKQSGQFLVQYNQESKVVGHRQELYQALTELIGTRPYMIQQGIPLITIENRPLDFRVLVLKPQNSWEVMGIMGKWAAKNNIVTNHSRGGSAITLDKALKISTNASDIQIKQMEKKLYQLGMEAATSLNKAFRGTREVGMDVAVDSKLNVWILETNSMPNFKLFKHHDDKKLFGKIAAYINYIRFTRKNMKKKNNNKNKKRRKK